jgi:hypothetical protein
MLGRLLIRLYSHLLKLYPDRFMDEFGGEMADVLSQTLTGLDGSGPPSITRRVKMARLFLREVWDFPRTYLDARRYQVSLGTGETPASRASYSEGDVTETWVGRPAPWTAAFMGALPFLLFGLAYLLEGITELGGHYGPAFNLLDGSLLDRPLNHPAIILTTPIGVYFVSVLGLLFGVIKGFPRWSYAYLGMSIYFGWYYSNGSFYGVVYGLWVWLPLIAAIILGLLLNRSLQPLTRLLQGVWNDWTSLSFALYAFFLPMQTVFFFDGDWGVFQLYGLVFDTVLLATVAVAFLRSRTSWGRVLSLEAAVLILVVKGILMGWIGELEGALDWPVLLFIIIIYFGLLLLPGVIGLLRGGVNALTSR